MVFIIVFSDRSKSSDVAKMNREREEKIRRYKESKELEESIKAMKIKVEEHCDEEIVRDYYLKLIRKGVHSALDELNSFEMEKEILEHMAKMRESGNGAAALHNASEKRRPLKPIIITRDALQKEVFGMGYKNLPVMSIEEFYEHRAQTGWFPQPGSLQDKALLQGNPQSAEESQEAEAAAKEAKEENDDPEELARKRNFDEYKDEHQRGEGNRHNKG